MLADWRPRSVEPEPSSQLAPGAPPGVPPPDPADQDNGIGPVDQRARMQRTIEAALARVAARRAAQSGSDEATE